MWKINQIPKIQINYQKYNLVKTYMTQNSNQFLSYEL